jgi:phage gp29-like protein
MGDVVLLPSQVSMQIPTKPARDLPVQSWSEWQQVGLVRNAIRALEIGIFDMASQVVDAMGRDDRISGCKLQRFQALQSLPVSFPAPKGDARYKRARSACEESFEGICPDAPLTELQSYGRFLGAVVGQLVWNRDGKLWMPRLRVWHPRFLRWRWDTRAYHVSTEEGDVQIQPGNGEWVLYTPYGYDRAWMKGDVRSLFVPWLVRQWGIRDWARYSEVHGMPIKKAVIPAGAQDDDRQRYLREVANLGSEPLIVTPRIQNTGETGDYARYDLELLEATGRTDESFDKLLNMASTCISITMLGQNLTSEVKGGSFAATMGHMQIRNDILQSDAQALGECLRTQVLGPFCEFNFGDRGLAPRPTWKTKPPEDKVQKGLAMKNLGDGILSLKSIGAKVDIDRLTSEDEIPTTGPAEEVDVNAVAAPQGGTPAPGEGGDRSRVPGKLPRPRTPAAQASRAKDVPTAFYEGQLYVDELTDNAIELSKATMRVDVRALLDIVDKAKSYEDIRKGLLKRYRGMSRDKLAELLKHTIELAQLAGRFAVSEET